MTERDRAARRRRTAPSVPPLPLVPRQLQQQTRQLVPLLLLMLVPLLGSLQASAAAAAAGPEAHEAVGTCSAAWSAYTAPLCELEGREQGQDSVRPARDLDAAGARGGPASRPAKAEETESQQYIVRFKSYQAAEEHHAQLSAELPGEGSDWEWVPRHNKASTLPTDFGLVRMHVVPGARRGPWAPRPSVMAAAAVAAAAGAAPSAPHAEHVARMGAVHGAQQQLLGRLDGLPFVKDVHRDKFISGRLNWQPEGELKQLFADAGGARGAGDAGGASSGGMAAAPAAATGGDSGGKWAHEETAAGSFSAACDNDGGGDGGVMKRPGRITTRFMMEGEEYEDDGSGGGGSEAEGDEASWRRRRQLMSRGAGAAAEALPLRGAIVQRGRAGTGAGQQSGDGVVDGADGSTRRARRLSKRPAVTQLMHAASLWDQGYTGEGIKVGVFDTGIVENHPHIRNIVERSNWTHQQSLSDGLGHGSFVAGVIGSTDAGCPGFAPDMQLFTFKVFTDDQVSYTSWFLDAFNYALSSGLHIINLSIGGPDFLDAPFVDKVLEITSNGIIMISAIGNDGPHWGTLNNPADQNDVIGVGGIDEGNNIAGFSSRGMSTWELPTGSGRVKPDVMAYGREVLGSRINGGCRTLSGTSVSSPVVAGAVALLASTLPESRRWMLNPASMKQALVEGAQKLPVLCMYEQGNGKMDLEASARVLAAYSPRASAIPAALDMADCPYFWPYCAQPLYAGALPVVVNVTLLNGMGVVGWLEGRPSFVPTNEGGAHLHAEYAWGDILWPWSGHLSVYVRVRDSGAAFAGIAEGTISLTVVAPPAAGGGGDSGGELQRSVVKIPVRAHIVPTPPRSKRLLWDQLHGIKYPPGYMPRDNLDVKHDVLDWHGDMLWTNFHTTFDVLRAAGYFVEVLASPWTCFDAERYGALIVVDPEDEYYPEEIQKIGDDVRSRGLSLIVFSEWYHVDSMVGMRFFDDNTRSWWSPATGGANVPALNDLLSQFGVAFGDAVVNGNARVGKHPMQIHHGSDVARMPAGSWLHRAPIASTAGPKASEFGVLGMTRPGGGAAGSPSGGAVVVVADSNCLDSSHQTGNCFEMLKAVLATAIEARATAAHSLSASA